MIIKYKVEVGFKDKYTGEKVKKDTVLDVDIKRMKELNEKGKGRVIDIIMDDTNVNESKNEKTDENQKADSKKKETSEVKYTEEELKEKTVNELKELAEKEGYELSKATKKDIIQEILELQK